MKKTISIIIVATILLICFSGCTSEFKQGNIIIPDNAEIVTKSTLGSVVWDVTSNFEHLQARITEDSREEKYFTYADNLVCKGTVVGNSFHNHNYKEWGMDYVVTDGDLFTPIRVEEIYYQGDEMTVEVEVGDIIYVGQYVCVFTEELLEHYPNALEKYNAKNVGDVFILEGANYEYREMLFKKGEEYLLFLPGRGNYEYNGKKHFYSEVGFTLLNIFNLSREPKTAEELGIESEYKINAYNSYLQIRKDAIDYYINGNKEVLK